LSSERGETIKKSSIPEPNQRSKEHKTLDHQPSFGEADTGSFTDINVTFVIEYYFDFIKAAYRPNYSEYSTAKEK